MRFVSLVNSVVSRARSGVSQGLSFGDGGKTSGDDAKPDATKLAEQVRQVMLRVNKLEAAASPEGVEFEVNCLDTGALIELPHGFKTAAVRWTVVGWFSVLGGVSPTGAPVLVYDGSSTTTSLFLRSYVAGRAVIRVERSQKAIDTGSPIDLTDTQAYPRLPLGPIRRRLTTTNTTSTNILTVQIPDNSVVAFRTKLVGHNKTAPTSNLVEHVKWTFMRNGGAAPSSILTGVDYSLVPASLTYSIAVVGNDVVFTVQCTTPAQTVDWTMTLEPLQSYLRDEP